MADLAFDLEYEGPALEAHEMDVRDLAPALLSTAELFQEMNRALHPADPEISVNVRATTEGSFLVQLKLIYKQTKDVLTGSDAAALLALSGLVGAAGKLINFVRKRARSSVVSQEPVTSQDAEPGLIRITYADGTTLEVPQRVLDLEHNVRIQRSLVELVRPLNREGINALRLRREDVTIGEVEKADLPAFEPLELAPPREVLATTEREVYLTILTAAFQTGNKWRFYDGQTAFFATLRDEDFIARVEQGEAFSKLDVLHCRVRHVQWRDSTGLHSEVEVLEVLQHLPHDLDAQGVLDLTVEPPDTA